MKRMLILVLATVMLIGIFSGCKAGGKTTESPAQTEQPSQTPDVSEQTPAAETPESVPEDPNYNFPKGKYETDEGGWPLNYYNYDSPISTTDEVFTYWTVCYTPEFIPEGGMGEVDFRQKEQEITE